MTNFEDLFRLVAENGGSISLDLVPDPTDAGSERLLRLRAQLGPTARGRPRDAVKIEMLIARRTAKRARDCLDVFYLRECVMLAEGALRKQIESPGAAADAIADELGLP